MGLLFNGGWFFYQYDVPSGTFLAFKRFVPPGQSGIRCFVLKMFGLSEAGVGWFSLKLFH
jgi:hypothetical protein